MPFKIKYMVGFQLLHHIVDSIGRHACIEGGFVVEVVGTNVGDADLKAI